MEILDHVASAIEEKLEKDPSKSFEKALNEVHSGFGVLGFSVMEDEFRKSFGALYKNTCLQIIKKYIIGNRLPLTLAVIALFYLVGLLFVPVLEGYTSSFNVYFYGLGMVVSLFCKIRSFSREKKWQKKSLVVGQLAAYGLFALILFGQLFGTIADFTVQENGTLSVAFFCLFSSIIALYGFIHTEISDWSYNWTLKRYLKHST